jgi:3-deoxy-D-arabino-heptulosonate 7-phosphate (DAHP) synthase
MHPSSKARFACFSRPRFPRFSWMDYGHGNSEKDATQQIEVADAIMWTMIRLFITP